MKVLLRNGMDINIGDGNNAPALYDDSHTLTHTQHARRWWRRRTVAVARKSQQVRARKPFACSRALRCFFCALLCDAAPSWFSDELINASYVQGFDFLLYEGADLSRVNADGNSVLHTACCSSTAVIVRKLVESNMALELRDREGYTPFFWTLDHEDKVVIALHTLGARTPLYSMLCSITHTLFVLCAIESRRESRSRTTCTSKARTSRPRTRRASPWCSGA